MVKSLWLGFSMFIAVVNTSAAEIALPDFEIKNFRTLTAQEVVANLTEVKDISYLDVSLANDDYATKMCKLDVLYPINMQKVPVIIYVHGGGLTGGDKSERLEIYKHLGLVMVSPNYRLSPQVNAPAYIEDVATAAKWVKDNIAQYNGDPDRIYIVGHSAGGFIVANLAVNPEYFGKINIKPEDFRGFMPISGEMITHFTIRKEQGIDRAKTTIDKFAPLFYANHSTPPLILLSGSTALDIPGRAADNKLMADLMRRAGNFNCINYEVAGADHGSIMDVAYAFMLSFIRKDLQGKWEAR